MVIIMMGVTGAGKTTSGTALASELGWRFVDGDLLHPAANVEKMRTGAALTDADRAPWLAALHAIVARARDRREHLVLACSALRDGYRQTLRGDLRTVRFVHLKVSEQVALERVAARPGHFAGPALVPSQFAALEDPAADAVTVDATSPPERIASIVREAFGV